MGQVPKSTTKSATARSAQFGSAVRFGFALLPARMRTFAGAPAQRFASVRQPATRSTLIAALHAYAQKQDTAQPSGIQADALLIGETEVGARAQQSRRRKSAQAGQIQLLHLRKASILFDFTALLDAYFRRPEAQNTEVTMAKFRRNVLNFSSFCQSPPLNRACLNQIQHSDVLAWRQYLLDTEGLSLSTADRKVGTLRALYNFAINSGLYAGANPALDVVAPSRASKAAKSSTTTASAHPPSTSTPTTSSPTTKHNPKNTGTPPVQAPAKTLTPPRPSVVLTTARHSQFL